MKAHITHTRAGTPDLRTITFISLSSRYHIQAHYKSVNNNIQTTHYDGSCWFRRVSSTYLLLEQHRHFHAQQTNNNSGRNRLIRGDRDGAGRIGSIGLGRGRPPPSSLVPRYSLTSFNKAVSEEEAGREISRNKNQDLDPVRTTVVALKESQRQLQQPNAFRQPVGTIVMNQNNKSKGSDRDVISNGSSFRQNIIRPINEASEKEEGLLSAPPSVSREISSSENRKVINTPDEDYLGSSAEEIEKAVVKLLNTPDGIKKITHNAITQIAENYRMELMSVESAANTTADAKSSRITQASINRINSINTPITVAAEQVLIPLIEHLISIVKTEKCIQWDSFDEDLIQVLPAFSQRERVVEAYLRQYENSESNYESQSKTTLIIKGDTGCGKSLIVPLIMLDCHWRGVLQGLEGVMKELRITVGLGDTNSTESSGGEYGVTSRGREECIVEERDAVPENFKVEFLLKDYFLPSDDKTSSLYLERFIQDFKKKSRIRICVAQPTRLASKSLAQFLNQQLSKTITSCLKNDEGGVVNGCNNTETLIDKAHNNSRHSGRQEERTPSATTSAAYHVLPLGQRVGYASSLDRCVDYETVEILFATSGYILMTMAGTSDAINGFRCDVVRDPVTGVNVKNNFYTNSLTGSTSNGTLNRTTHPFMQQTHSTDGLTLIIDEAHRRDIQLDLLLSWAKHWMLSGETRQGPTPILNKERAISHNHQHHSQVNRRQLVVMSASLDVEAYMDYFNNKVTLTSYTSIGGKGSNEYSITLRSAFLNLTPDRKDAYLRDNDGSSLIENNMDNISDESLKQKEQSSSCYTNVVLFGDDLKSLAESISSNKKGERVYSTSRDIALDVLSRANLNTLNKIQSIIESRSGLPFSYKKIRIVSEASAPQGRELYELVAMLSIDVVDKDRNVLVFVPGYAEIVHFMNQISRLNQFTGIINLTNHSEDGTSSMDNGQTNSSDSASSSSITFLKEGTLIVDVIALHSTAIGESVGQLEKSKAKAKIIVSTNVAESSVTVPNVSLVIDTCLERVSSQVVRASSSHDSILSEVNGEHLGQTKIITVPSGLTGIRGSLITRLASKSSLLQRRGRTGRTCNGCTIHLISRAAYESHCSEYTEARWQESENTTENFILLAKLLFGRSTCGATLSFSDICCSLPGAPFERVNPIPLMKTMEEMIKTGLVVPPTQKTIPLSTVVRKKEGSPQSDVDKLKEEWDYLNNCTLTVKGQFVAAIPIESTLGATFVFNGLLFDCMIETIVLAAAISSGVMINTANTYGSTSGDAKLVSDGLDQVEGALHRRLELATEGICQNDEIWLTYLLVTKWYQLEGNLNEKWEFIDRFMLSKSALARMDEIVIMTCTRLIQLLQASLEEEQQDVEGKGQRTAIFAFSSSAGVRGAAVNCKDGLQTTKELLYQLFKLRTAAILNTMASFRGRKPKGLPEIFKTTDLQTYIKLKSAFIATFIPKNYLLGSVSENTSSSNEALSISRNHRISALENWVGTSKNRQILSRGIKTFHRNDTAPLSVTAINDNKVTNSHNDSDNNEDSSVVCIFPLSIYIGAKKITSRTRLKLGGLTHESKSIIDDGELDKSDTSVTSPIDNFLDESNTLTESDIFQCISEKNVREALSYFFRSSNFVKIESISFLSKRRVVVAKFSHVSSHGKNGEENEDVDFEEKDEDFLLDPVPLKCSIDLLSMNTTTAVYEPSNANIGTGVHHVSPLRSVPFAAWLLRCLPVVMRESKVRIPACVIAERLNEKKVIDAVNLGNDTDDIDFQNSDCKKSDSVSDYPKYVDIGEIVYEPIEDESSNITKNIGDGKNNHGEKINSSIELRNDHTSSFGATSKLIEDTSQYHYFYKYNYPYPTQVKSLESENRKNNTTGTALKINLTKAEQLGYSDWIPSYPLLEEVRNRRKLPTLCQEGNENDEGQNYYSSVDGVKIHQRRNRPNEEVIVINPIPTFKQDNGNFGHHYGSQSQKINSPSIGAYNLTERIFLRFEDPIIPNSLRWKTTVSPLPYLTTSTADLFKSLDTSHIAENLEEKIVENYPHKPTSDANSRDINPIVCPVCSFAALMREDNDISNSPTDVSIIPKGRIAQHICTSLHHLESIRTLLTIGYDGDIGISFETMKELIHIGADDEKVEMKGDSDENKEIRPHTQIQSIPRGPLSPPPPSSFFSPTYTPAACLTPILPSSLLYCDLRYSHLLQNPLYPLRTNPVGVAGGIVTKYHVIQQPLLETQSHQHGQRSPHSAPVTHAVSTSLFSSAIFMDLAYSRQDCFLVLHASILNLAMGRREKVNYSMEHLSSHWGWGDKPLLLLFNESHTKIYGFMVMGILTCEIPPKNNNGKKHEKVGGVNSRRNRGFFGSDVIQHLLKIKNSASSFAALDRRDLSIKSTNENTKNISFSLIQESTKSICVSKAAEVHGVTLEGLRIMLGRGISLAIAEGNKREDGTDSDGPPLTEIGDGNNIAEERLHWCPLHSSCCTAYCERAANNSIRKALAKTEDMGGDGNTKLKLKRERERKTVLGSNWFTSHPVELLASTQILILLNESRHIGRESYQMQYFYARLVHLLALKVKQQKQVDSSVIYNNARVGVSGGLNDTKVSKNSSISTEINQNDLDAGERVIDAFVKLRGAKHLEEILLLCGCKFSTSKKIETGRKIRIPIENLEIDLAEQNIVPTDNWSESTFTGIITSKTSVEKKPIVSIKYDHGYMIYMPRIIASSVPPPTLLPWMSEGVFYD